MKNIRTARILTRCFLGILIIAFCGTADAGGDPTNDQIISAFGKQGIRINNAEAQGVREEVLIALREARQHGIGDSKVDFSAVQIAHALGLDTTSGSNTVNNIVAAIRHLHGRGGDGNESWTLLPPPEWGRYFDETVGLWSDRKFMDLVRKEKFFPVKISWEDIGRYAGSVWGDRISDVGIWVRREEGDPQSGQLALSVRRDSNFRDKVLVVPSERIKIHQRSGGRTVEKTLPERLKELGLASAARDKNVIVSNQFAIVPVPSRQMRGAWPKGVPPRAAFNFSIFPYGSTNFVITDVIEGSHDAVVGPGTHQMLFANIDGKKAPFTASRAEDRPDLLALEKELKSQGMDVDVQRYYLIQIPLKKEARNIRPSNMGTPPFRYAGGAPGYYGDGDIALAPSAAPPPQSPSKESLEKEEHKGQVQGAGLAKVAIGHGETEGDYFAGSGYEGQRSEEPVRVTVVYFVTPVGRVTSKDMDGFVKTFSAWDSQAIWGGSFVTKETM